MFDDMSPQRFGDSLNNHLASDAQHQSNTVKIEAALDINGAESCDRFINN